MKGLSDVKQACLDIENKINDSISPQPNYTLERQNHDQKIKLTIKSGLQKPKTTHLLKTMEEKSVVAVEGKGRGTKYIIK